MRERIELTGNEAVGSTPEAFDAMFRFTNNGGVVAHSVGFSYSGPPSAGKGGGAGFGESPSTAGRDQTVAKTVRIVTPPDASISRPYFTRTSPAESRYVVAAGEARAGQLAAGEGAAGA